jgi:NDP-sugar pyrophosphorylase family protein
LSLANNKLSIRLHALDIERAVLDDRIDNLRIDLWNQVNHTRRELRDNPNEEETMSTHDFEDGNGPVPAHKHDNWDGTEGGWVADTATVIGARVLITQNAKVYGYAYVANQASILDHARVYGDAIVTEKAKIFENARVFEDARVYGEGWVQGSANVCGDSRICSGATVRGTAMVYERAVLSGTVEVQGGRIYGQTVMTNGRITGGDYAIVQENEAEDEVEVN